MWKVTIAALCLAIGVVHAANDATVSMTTSFHDLSNKCSSTAFKTISYQSNTCYNYQSYAVRKTLGQCQAIRDCYTNATTYGQVYTCNLQYDTTSTSTGTRSIMYDVTTAKANDYACADCACTPSQNDLNQFLKCGSANTLNGSSCFYAFNNLDPVANGPTQYPNTATIAQFYSDSTCVTQVSSLNVREFYKCYTGANVTINSNPTPSASQCSEYMSCTAQSTFQQILDFSCLSKLYPTAVVVPNTVSSRDDYLKINGTEIIISRTWNDNNACSGNYADASITVVSEKENKCSTYFTETNSTSGYVTLNCGSNKLALNRSSPASVLESIILSLF